MIETIVNNASGPTIKINAVQQSGYKKWLSAQSDFIQNWLSNIGFNACPGDRALIPNNKGDIETVLFVEMKIAVALSHHWQTKGVEHGLLHRCRFPENVRHK